MASIRKSCDQRFAVLKTERSYFEDYWRELSKYYALFLARFTAQERYRGHKANIHILNNSALVYKRRLGAALSAYITSPERPWFRLAMTDKDLMEFGPVKIWLEDSERAIYHILARSNFYPSMPSMYEDMAVYGQAPMLAWDHMENIVHFEQCVMGEYYLGAGDDGRINTLYREFDLTVHQCVQRFGESAVSDHVRNLMKNNSLDKRITVVHAIEPNDDRIPGATDNRNMPWRSVYYEAGGESDKYLEYSGMRENPILCARWHQTGIDPYATSCPGMDALGDQKQLQVQEKETSKNLNKVGNPLLQGPTTVVNRLNAGAMRGGHIIAYDPLGAGDGGSIKPVFEINPYLQEFMMANQELEARIAKAFYQDLLLVLHQNVQRQKTATEVSGLRDESLIVFGPMLTRMISEFLDPLIDRVFALAVEASRAAWAGANVPAILPKPPPELAGISMEVEYISLLAQAQKSVGLSSLERTTAFIGDLAQRTGNITILDKIDLDQTIDEYAAMSGVSPRVIRTDDDVAQIRKQRAEAEQMQNAMNTAQQGADIANKLADASTEGPNALTALAGGAAA
jgi:hypothetical protein